jgi:hypothetical protein
MSTSSTSELGGAAAQRLVPARAALRWVLFGLVWIPGAWLLYRWSRPGPDFFHYAQWGLAGVSGNIFALRSDTGSPLGLPATVWPHGAGFVLATGGLLLGDRVELLASMMVVGWLAAVVLWWATFRILVRAAGGRTPLILLGIALAFVGTHAGYYSSAHATESLSLACGAALAAWVVNPAPRTLTDTIVTAILSALLVTIRPQLLPYAVLALAILAYRLYTDGRLASPGRVVIHAVPPVVAMLIAVVEIAFVNRWTTGSVLVSQASFGNGTFESIDVRHPELLAVLIHPWHGVLVYHPLYLLAVVALAGGMVDRATPPRRRALYAGIVAVTLAHLYTQAVWFCWWMGVATFGMRGMAICAVTLVPALIARLAERETAGRSNRIWVIACLAATLWSYLLMLQGESNYLTYRDLLYGSDGGIGQIASLWQAIVPMATVAVVITALAIWDHSPGTVVRGVGAAILALAIALHCDAPFGPQLSTIARATVSGVAGAGLFVTSRSMPVSTRSRAVEGVVAAAILIVFTVGTAAFLRLAIHTEAMVANNGQWAHRFPRTGTVPLGQVAASYDEYLHVPDFDRKKAAFAQYLIDAGVLR